MDLPQYERIIYKRNPLSEVICQLRFPPILKIVQEKPADFQDLIRADYPYFESSQPSIPDNLTQLSEMIGLPLDDDKVYVFESEDREWKLTLTKDAISLVAENYERYEDFKSRFQYAIKKFEEIYKPSFYIRIGLRYQDLIIRSDLDLEDTDWQALISENLAPELYNPELSKSLKGFMKNLRFEIEKGFITLRHGTVNVTKDGVQQNELSYLIDADFYTEQKVKSNDEIWENIDDFNRMAGKLFRYSITQKLHEAMEPTIIGNS